MTTWHAIARVGLADRYEPELDDVDPRISLGFRRPGDQFSAGPDLVAETARLVGRLPSDSACDMLNIATAVYGADLTIPRSYGDNRWERDICVHVPVKDLSTWHAVEPSLCKLLRFLTGDNWRFLLRSQAEVPTPKLGADRLAEMDATCLFSGGLDSLVGAIDFLAEGLSVALVGHHGSGLTNPVQQRLLAELHNTFGSRLREFMYSVQPPKSYWINTLDKPSKVEMDGEASMRSRSFLFLALGTMIAATVEGTRRLIVAENGLISLNVPLTIARMGSLSTRTTHPYFMEEYRQLLRLVGIPVEIELPYRFLTKGEMLRDAHERALLARLAPISVSCSHPEIGRYRKHAPGGHCGYCVPCIIRRASLNAAGLAHGDYEVDVLTAPPSHTSDCGRDLRAFQMAIEGLRGASLRELVGAVQSTGPLPNADCEAYASVYRRGMNEVSMLLGLGSLL